MQSKSLQTIYKQLVRVLHPDLERDSQKRTWKEELMKKLTVAYENNDLFSLLTIEMEWMNASAEKIRSQNDTDLKIYNAILKDQIQELQVSIDMLFMHPRNLPIQKFYRNGFNGIASLKKKAIDLKKLIQEIQETMPRLQTKQAKTIFKEIIQQRVIMQNLERISCTCGTC
jgi:paraquat-inducible protein B